LLILMCPFKISPVEYVFDYNKTYYLLLRQAILLIMIRKSSILK